jgi:putative heme-binding domain-containing protein
MTSAFSRAAVALLLSAGLCLAVWYGSAADDPKKDATKTAEVRKPWTTSKVVGSPDPPPPFKAVRVFPNVKFHHPLLIARCPGTDRLFIGEQEGYLYSVANKPDATKDLVFDLRKELKTIDKTPGAGSLGELYGFVFHPKFEQNRACYVCYTLRPKQPKGDRFADGTRVSRFKMTDTNPPRIDPASEEIVITFIGGGHNGGDLHFGPDGMLYITTGDAASPNPPDPLNTGQDCSDLLSSVLRIDVDHKDAGKNYAVPKDNPFVGMKDVRPEIWAYGFRNPWRMSFDRQTGDLWLGDVGWELWEMVHKVEKGGNYGWSIMEGPQPIKPTQKPGPTPIRPAMIELPHTIACSVTGGYVYRGKKFPELVGAYVFGDWETRRIWSARFEGDRVKEMPEIVKLGIRMSAFGEDNDGEIYFVEYDHGTVHTLARNEAVGKNSNFPTKLSETGLFKDVKGNVPADGVIPFSPNARQWQDGATAEYLLALPGTSSVTLFDKPRPLAGQVFWHEFKMQFPPGAVLVKTNSLDVIPGGKRRVETQILHHDGEDWRGYSYTWRDDQTDAELVPAEGAEKVFEVPAPILPQGKREQVWTFHSRSQCITCHNSWSEYALAFNPRQLNGGGWIDGGPGSRVNVPNDLLKLNQEGYVRRVGRDDKPLPAFDEKTIAEEQALPDSRLFARLTREQFARSYLHVNCAHCHRFGGGGGQVVLELDYSKPLKEMGILDVPPKQGDFGIHDARIVKPGDPTRSVLLYRMAKFGRGRMPHLGSDIPDDFGLRIVSMWISSLGKRDSPPPARMDALDTALRSPDTAIPFACRMSQADLDKAERDKILAAAAKLEAGPVRDLFEGYLPPDPKGRKLGSSPRSSSILGLTGDAKRGEAVFFTKELKCAECHKIGDKGVALGPELTAIGKTRTKAELLESVLEPSRRVEPQFTSYLVKTLDGRTVTGLLVKRDDKQVILRDAQNKEIVLAAGDVEAVQPSRLSLMPDGLVAGLTPQEAADLIEFLATRK